MIKRLLQVGIILAGFASMPSWAILIDDGGVFDGTNVGVVDTFMAETGVLSGEAAETAWVNSILALDVEFVVKTEPVVYYTTDGTPTTSGEAVFAFDLRPTSADYFLVKNSQGTALFQNEIFLDWGVFDTSFLSSAMNLGTEPYTISHVTQFNPVPEPGMIGLLAIGLLGMVVTRRKMKL